MNYYLDHDGFRVWKGTTELLSSHSIHSRPCEFRELRHSEIVLDRLEPTLKYSCIDSNVSCIFLEIHTGATTGQTMQRMWIVHTNRK